MTHGEKGYVQFRFRWEDAPPPATPLRADLLRWRERLHAAGLVGVYPDGIGFGNLSCRAPGAERFVVTGTGTGHLPALGPEHLTEVSAYDVDGNWLRCRGPVVASSESLSHAAVYRALPAACAVVHVHHAALWARLLHRAPTTDPAAEAGTPAMAHAIERLLRDLPPASAGGLVMGGHPEGLIAWGDTVDAAGAWVIGALEDEEEGGG